MWQVKMSQLGNKVVLVTGASSGIGREFCLDLARAGCRTIAAARRVKQLDSLCHHINRDGLEWTRAIELDVMADDSAIQEAVRKAWDAFGEIDVLINCAGIRGPVKSMLDLSLEEWNTTMTTNLTGLWLVSKYVCSLMRNANKSGSVIHISSIAGISRSQPLGGIAYIASKTGVNAIRMIYATQFMPHSNFIQLNFEFVTLSWLLNINLNN